MWQKISLIVDDELSIWKYINSVLPSDGFQTSEAENWVQALELMRKLGTGVDLPGVQHQNAKNGWDHAGVPGTC